MHAELNHRFTEFLESAGWADARVAPIPGDASFRRYFRVDAGFRRAILMDAPPPHEDTAPFLYMARYLAEQGLRAPAIHTADQQQGLVLLEDFGDRRMRETVDEGGEDQEQTIYGQAIDTLVRLHQRPHADLPPYSESEYHREAGLFVEWYCPARGLDVDVDGYHAAWSEALAPLGDLSLPQVTVLRDYHAENIMLLDDGDQGLLDFQDALVGHPAYDLVSLLQDARRDVPPQIETDMLTRYSRAIAVDYDLDAHYHILGAQRNAKIVGIFVRLWKRDGKPRYPLMIPRVWGQLERDLAHPALAPVADWFAANIPDELRDPAGELGGAFEL